MTTSMREAFAHVYTQPSQNAYDFSMVKQSIFLDSKLKTNCTAQILSNINHACKLLS